jgi:3-oxosteroid 1-dehydrogenase
VPLWNNTAARELVLEDGGVIGVIVEKEGQPMNIQARKGVLLAAGGFEHNQEMREQYLPHPTNAEWSAANPDNTGDAIRMAQALGAVLDLMDDAWWIPSGLPPDTPPIILVGERSFPRQVIVNSAGKRFINEATPYHQFGHVMYAENRESASTIPATMIFDRRYRNRYIFGQTVPLLTPRKFLESGYFRRAGSLEELAEQVAVDRGGLAEIIRQFNRNAAEGKDPQFGRGESALDRYYGDPTSRPNPCLGPIDTPPFYAVALYPGDLGTKGGLLTDEWARVLRQGGAPIPGLYACGNTSASVMGKSYPGAGATIGPAMTFGYLSALHASGEVG